MKIPPELLDAYIMQRMRWDVDQLRNTPHYLIEQIQLIWHLEQVASDAQAEKLKPKRSRKL